MGANERIEILKVTSRAAGTTSLDYVNPTHTGLHLMINCTDVVGSGSVITYIEGKDEISEKYYTLATSTSVVASGITVVKMYPGLAAGTNIFDDFLPYVWRVRTEHADTQELTYGVSANLSI